MGPVTTRVGNTRTLEANVGDRAQRVHQADDRAMDVTHDHRVGHRINPPRRSEPAKDATTGISNCGFCGALLSLSCQSSIDPLRPEGGADGCR